jgi:hypothetical protein
VKFRDYIEKIGAYLIIGVCCAIALPILLLYFLFKLLITPYDYIKYKNSLYQKDYPKRYTWLSTPHIDNEAYTAIKENGLPVEYIKWRDDYDMSGYFIYKNSLLVFNEPLFFDKKKGIYLCWIHDDEEEEQPEIEEENADEDNTDDCLTVEETIKHILEEFHNNVSGYMCNRVVFFYKQENVEGNYEEGGLEKMLALDDFVVYENGELAKAIREYIESNS